MINSFTIWLIATVKMNLINGFFQAETKPCENKSEESFQNFLVKIKSNLYYKKFLEHFGDNKYKLHL